MAVGDMDEAKVLFPCPPVAVAVDAVDSRALDLLSSGTKRDSHFQTERNKNGAGASERDLRRAFQKVTAPYRPHSRCSGQCCLMKSRFWRMPGTSLVQAEQICNYDFLRMGVPEKPNIRKTNEGPNLFHSELWKAAGHGLSC